MINYVQKCLSENRPWVSIRIWSFFDGFDYVTMPQVQHKFSQPADKQ